MAKKNRFVTPETERLPLSDGEWIDIKKRLTAGESRQVSLGCIRGVKEDPETGKDMYDVDTVKRAFAKVEAYLLDWSFTDDQDKRVQVSPDAIRALSPEAFSEVEAAIDAHVQAQEAAKNAPAPASTSI